MKNAITTRRLTFQPVTPRKYLRPASLPVGHPVQALQDGETWTLTADVDGLDDYTVTADPSDFAVIQ
jgi:hypothetical protein